MASDDTTGSASPPEALSIDLGAMRRRAEVHAEVDASASVAWLKAILSDTDAVVPAPGRVTLSVTLQPRGIVLVQGRLEVGLTVPCGRCLAAAAVDGSAKLSATYLPAASAALEYASAEEVDDEGIALAEEDLDAWSYEGTRLELSPLIAEYVQLAYPMRALCERGEACRGLCSQCGAVLNELAVDVLECANCHSAVPANPVADPLARMAPVTPSTPAAPAKVGSLADALKKAGFEPSS